MKEDLFKNTYRSKMPLTSDYVFRSVFGRDTEESRGALIELLNMILERKKDPIRKITINNPIDTAEKNYEKETVMDIRATTDSGELLDIEMQAWNFNDYENRALYYGGRLVNSSLQSGENYDKMKKSIVVSIIDGILFNELPSSHNIFEVRERETGLLMCDRLEFHFLELGKTDLSKPPELLASAERAAVYLKYASDEDKIDYIQEILDWEDLDMSENLYRKVTAEEIEYEKQESRYRFMLDMNTMKSVAEEKGLAKGLERGRNEGAVNKQHEIAKKMREEGIDLELISRITDLPVETIETLR